MLRGSQKGCRFLLRSSNQKDYRFACTPPSIQAAMQTEDMRKIQLHVVSNVLRGTGKAKGAAAGIHHRAAYAYSRQLSGSCGYVVEGIATIQKVGLINLWSMRASSVVLNWVLLGSKQIACRRTGLRYWALEKEK